MQNDRYEICTGPISGLRLPRKAWDVLLRENITTIDQLKAVADRIERVVHGIGPKTARMIRAEVVRVTALEEHSRRRPLS